MHLATVLILSQANRELVGLVAVLTTILGIWMQWHRQSHLSDIEESVKNGDIPPDEGHRRIRFVDWRATVLVVAGMGLLVFSAVNWNG
jgi:hypothetical protein